MLNLAFAHGSQRMTKKRKTVHSQLLVVQTKDKIVGDDGRSRNHEELYLLRRWNPIVSDDLGLRH